MFEIEKNIEIERQNSRRAKYPFRNMEIGDSFQFNKEDVKKISAASWAYGKAHEVKFSIRKISDTEYRIWRIKDKK